MGVRIGIDTGGTLTDPIGLDGATGMLVFGKTPSIPRDPVQSISDALDISGVGRDTIEFLVLGTAIATNALLQRRGADFIFLTTQGFDDVPFIQRMNPRYPSSPQWTNPHPPLRR